MESPLLIKYPHAKAHLENTWSRRQDWAVCLQLSRHLRGNHTNNFVEAAMRVLKDQILQRMKVKYADIIT